jgi:glycosyltransferase involved in cell wall biosynthesis
MNNRSTFRKRHCMIVHAYYPIGEIRVEREARALLEQGYEVDVICLQQKGEPAFSVEDSVNTHRLPVMRHKGKGVMVQFLEYLAFFVLAFFKVTALHLKRRYNIVQVHNLPDFLIFSALIPKLSGARLILDLHDLMPEFYAARFRSGMSSFPSRLLCWQEKLSCLFANHVITVTELWRQTLIERGIPAAKISVVMNVANDRIFNRSNVKHVANQGHFDLIYHGQLSQRYGIDLAIQAVGLLRSEIPEIRFTVHGRGDYLDELRKLTETLGMEEHVRFSTQYMPTLELPQLVGNAHAGIVPYRKDIFTDGILPTKLMEYAALGVPVIAARTTAIAAYFDPEMIQYFTPEDVNDLASSIRLLYNDRERLAQYARNIEKFNQRYNWKLVAAEYVQVVERLSQKFIKFEPVNEQ